MARKKMLRFAEDLYCRYEDDEISALGAQMTYYFILAFFPFLIFLLTVVGYTPLTAEEVLVNMAGYLPETTYNIVVQIIPQIIKERSDTLLSIGMAATLWAASSGMSSIIKGLNKAYDEAETRAWWKLKGIAVLFTLAIAVVLLIAFALLVFGHLLWEEVFARLEHPDYYEVTWNVLKYLIPASAMMLVFCFLYRYVPNRRLSFRSVIPGSLFASVGWIVISLLFSFYVNNFNSYTRTYGSIGGIIVLLIWLYLSSIIILIGGEINASLTFRREGRKKPQCKTFVKRLSFWEQWDWLKKALGGQR